VLTAFIAVGMLGAVPAQASVPTTYCDGKSMQSVANTYYRGSAANPLRCGTSTWAFLHITQRWDAAFDSNIALTIARGEVVRDLQQDGGNTIYALFDKDCNELFRVIYNSNAYLANTTINPQGIITAFYSAGSGTAIVPLTAPADAGPAYRTDCEVIQNI
jgi:hypothetical protein